MQAACNYVMWSGDTEWLRKTIGGEKIIERLDKALRYLLDNKVDSKTGLLVGAHTIDWGDVELGDADQQAIYADESTIWTTDIYDQTMFVIAAKQLAELYRILDDSEREYYWLNSAEDISKRTREILWMPSRGYFRVCSHITSFEHSFDEDSIFAMGGNAMAVLAGIATEKMAASIFDVAIERQNQYGISTISGVLLPPYPAETFSHSAVSSEYSYQNGGQWDWFGARLLLAMYENGYADIANQKLEEIAKKVSSNKQINEWEDPDGNPKGSSNYIGAAGMLARAITEGKYGIKVDCQHVEIEPHIEDEGRIMLHDCAAGNYVGYSYERLNDETISFKLHSDYSEETVIRIQIPEEWNDYVVVSDENKIIWKDIRKGEALYAEITLKHGGDIQFKIFES